MRILGCWYTHFDPLNMDRDRALLECSLRSVEKMAAASEKCEPGIATCVWKPLGSLIRFEEFVHWQRQSSHLCIAQQILRILYEMDERGEQFDYVALLEHDVMYPHDYFDRIANAVESTEDEGKLLSITRATYGGEDVTEVVDRMRFSDQVFTSNTDLTGGDDPQPGVFKKLVIDYEAEVGERSQSWDEGHTVAWTTLGCGRRDGARPTNATNPCTRCPAPGKWRCGTSSGYAGSASSRGAGCWSSTT